jgi:hypothetical protein
MEPLGSHYAVLLHDPQLRKGLIAEAGRSRPHEQEQRPSVNIRLRLWLAHVLQGLATRVEPSASTWSPRPQASVN